MEQRKSFSELEKYLTRAFEEVWEIKNNYNLSLREASFVLALKRIYEGFKNN